MTARHIASEADLATFLHDVDSPQRPPASSVVARAHDTSAGGRPAAATMPPNAVSDVDQAWQHLTRQLHPEAVRAEAQAYAEQLRHHAAEHVGDLSKPRSWKVPVIIGIVAAAIAGGAMWYITQLGDRSRRDASARLRRGDAL